LGVRGLPLRCGTRRRDAADDFGDDEEGAEGDEAEVFEGGAEA